MIIIENQNEINKIIELENKILEKLQYDRYMNKAHKLKEQLMSNNIRVFCNNEDNQIITNKILVKISGIWETENSCGLTFKFFNVTNNLTIVEKYASIIFWIAASIH